jgi:indole-3-glycerol phosphate synthase
MRKNQRQLHNIEVQKQRVAKLHYRLGNYVTLAARGGLSPKQLRRANGVARKFLKAKAELKRLEGGLVAKARRNIMALLEGVLG